MKFTKHSLLALATVGVCAALVPACSNNDQSSPSDSNPTGRLDLNLVTSGGNQINSVDEKIFSGTTTTGTPVISQTFDVHTTNALIKAFTGALAAPAATNSYTASFVATGPGITCSGTQTFNIVANTKTTANVQLSCVANSASAARGSAELTGQIVSTNACPFAQNTAIAPLQTDVGATISLQTDVSGTATVAWTASEGTPTPVSGTFNATYVCPSAGTKTITLTITRAGTACIETITEDVVCVGAGGAGGATGAGGAGTGGAGTGGAGTGGSGTGGSGTGGSGTGGSGTGGMVVMDPFCGQPFNANVPSGYQGILNTPTTATQCATCEALPTSCPHDPSGCSAGACDTQPFCTDYPAAADQAACNAVQKCVRQTNCIALGITNCFCGNTDMNTCTGSLSGPAGACKSEIIAGFPSGTTAAAILSGLTDVSAPAGGAMSLESCDHDNCATQCIPYCK